MASLESAESDSLEQEQAQGAEGSEGNQGFHVHRMELAEVDVRAYDILSTVLHEGIQGQEHREEQQIGEDAASGVTHDGLELLKTSQNHDHEEVGREKDTFHYLYSAADHPVLDLTSLNPFIDHQEGCTFLL